MLDSKIESYGETINSLELHGIITSDEADKMWEEYRNKQDEIYENIIHYFKVLFDRLLTVIKR